MTSVSVWRRREEEGEVEGEVEVGGTWHNFRKLQFCDGLEHWWPAASARPSLDKDTTLLRTWPGSLASVGMGESLVTGQHCFSLSQGIYRFSLSQYSILEITSRSGASEQSHLLLPLVVN